jgi:hypothetical protein
LTRIAQHIAVQRAVNTMLAATCHGSAWISVLGSGPEPGLMFLLATMIAVVPRERAGVQAQGSKQGWKHRAVRGNSGKNVRFRHAGKDDMNAAGVGYCLPQVRARQKVMTTLDELCSQSPDIKVLKSTGRVSPSTHSRFICRKVVRAR